MTRKQKITLGASLAGMGIVYLVYNSIRSKKLYTEIFNAIGGSSINISNYNEWFNPTYFNNYSSGGFILLTEGTALQKARKLGESFGTFFNDSNDIIGVIRTIPDGVALSQVSAKFESKGYGDLRTQIGEMDKQELSAIGQILSKKPPFRNA
jgi:hypothetical protein|tara:strand:+ start:3290 stop:3745 length:456 start_codon:yes stop_codon:yes gene_type:complete